MKQIEKNRLSREKIIKAGIAAFANNDFEKVSQNEFCREHNISKGKLYHYFSSKEDLYYSCINFILSCLAADMLSYSVDKNKSVSDNFHKYYELRIDYWMRHPDDLLLVKFALDNFTKKEYVYIKEQHLEVRKAMRIKTVEILNIENISDKISIDDLNDVIQLIYEKTFMIQLKKIIVCLKEGDLVSAEERKKILLDMYDKLIYIMLHGILS